VRCTPRLLKAAFLACKSVLRVGALRFARWFCAFGRGQFGDSHRSIPARNRLYGRAKDDKSSAWILRRRVRSYEGQLVTVNEVNSLELQFKLGMGRQIYHEPRSDIEAHWRR